MSKFITYVFLSPFPVDQTVHAISQSLEKCGNVKVIDDNRGFVVGRIKTAPLLIDPKIEFYVERGRETCKVRALLYNEILDVSVGTNPLRVRITDGIYDQFIRNLLSLFPACDFGVTLSNKNAYIVEAQFLDGETEIVSRSTTVGGCSLSGFLLGGLFGGEAGAIVGGTSGTRRTVGHTYTTLSKQRLVRVIHNNGRIGEGLIWTNSKVYQEIMVNMK